MSTLREQGLTVLREMLPDRAGGGPAEPGFADGLREQSLEMVFGGLWARPGLDRRSRSLVTLGILIALRAEDELRIHFPAALRNGLTRQELEEVVYHAAGYAGFPAAATARLTGREVLDSLRPDTSPRPESS